METDTKVPASAGGCSLDSLVGLAEKRVETHRNVKLARQTLREAVTALELAMARMAEADMLYQQQSSQSNNPSSLTASRKAADERKGTQ